MLLIYKFVVSSSSFARQRNVWTIVSKTDDNSTSLFEDSSFKQSFRAPLSSLLFAVRQDWKICYYCKGLIVNHGLKCVMHDLLNKIFPKNGCLYKIFCF